MGIILAVIFAKIGAKRIIGGFTSFMLCLLLGPIGIFIVLGSRRLNDEAADAALLAKFSREEKPVLPSL